LIAELEPEVVKFEPFVRLSLGLNNSIEGDIPSICRYDGTNYTWTLIDSNLSENRISAEITNFSVYAVLAESSVKVELHVNPVLP